MTESKFKVIAERLRQHGADARYTFPPVRRKESKKHPQTSISHMIDRLRNECGMTLQAITDGINVRFATQFSVATVHTWSQGRIPRKVSPDEVERALEEMYASHEHIEGGAWVPAEHVKATIQGWRGHLTIRQIAICADENVSTVSAWAMGNHAVFRPKWNRVTEEVEAMMKVMGLGSDKTAHD